MRTAAAATALGLTLIAAAGLAACAPEDPVRPPDPGPTQTPVFASEEEALAAAEELYGEYLEAENLLAVGGWQSVDVVEPYVRGDALDNERESAERFRDAGLTQVGGSTFDSVEVQQLEDSGDQVSMTVYLCIDVSTVDVIDASGESVVPDGRLDRSGLEVEIDNKDGRLKIARSEAWTGASFC